MNSRINKLINLGYEIHEAEEIDRLLDVFNERRVEIHNDYIVTFGVLKGTSFGYAVKLSPNERIEFTLGELISISEDGIIEVIA